MEWENEHSLSLMAVTAVIVKNPKVGGRYMVKWRRKTYWARLIATGIYVNTCVMCIYVDNTTLYQAQSRNWS